MFRHIIPVFLLWEAVAAVIYKLNETEYNKMPALYGLDDYNSCLLERGAVYCVIDVELFSTKDSKLMRMIQEYSEHTTKHFNHKQIHRGVCVNTTCAKFMPNNTGDLSKTLEVCLNDSLWEAYGIESKLSKIHYCKTEGMKTEFDISDFVMIAVYVIIILFNIVGSLYDSIVCKNDEIRGNSILLSFSVRRNWAKLTASSSNGTEPRMERLKAFHGIRTLIMMCVIFSHAMLTITYSYIDNPLYIERAYDSLPNYIALNGNLVTYIFFIMSSFLMAYRIEIQSEAHEIRWLMWPKGILLRWLSIGNSVGGLYGRRVNGHEFTYNEFELSKKNIVMKPWYGSRCKYAAKYYRLTPSYALILATISTVMRHLGDGPLWDYVVSSESYACRQYWWSHIFYFNNYIYNDVFCLPQTWYVAADTQLYCIGLLICILRRKYKIKIVPLVCLFVLSLIIPAAHTYFQDLDAVIIQSPEDYRSMFLNNKTYHLLFSLGHTAIPIYILGLGGGLITYHWQKVGKDFKRYKNYRWLMWLIMPFNVGLILSGAMFYVDGWMPPIGLRVVYATFHRVVFQFLIGILIISCVFKFEDFYRGIFEWRGFSWTGRVTYGAYLIHFIYQRVFVGVQTSPIHLNNSVGILIVAASIFTTYSSAAILWLLVEAPAVGLTRVLFAVSQEKKPDVEASKI